MFNRPSSTKISAAPQCQASYTTECDYLEEVKHSLPCPWYSPDNIHNFNHSTTSGLDINAENYLDSRWYSISCMYRKLERNLLDFDAEIIETGLTKIGMTYSKLFLTKINHMRYVSVIYPMSQRNKIGSAWEEKPKLCSDRLENSWWESRATDIQGFADQNDIHSFYESLKQVSGLTNRVIMPVRNIGGDLMRDKGTILERWANTSAVYSILRVLLVIRYCMTCQYFLPQCIEPTSQEVLDVIKSLKITNFLDQMVFQLIL